VGSKLFGREDNIFFNLAVDEHVHCVEYRQINRQIQSIPYPVIIKVWKYENTLYTTYSNW